MKKIQQLIPEAIGGKPKSSEWLPKLRLQTEIRNRYGDAAGFLSKFNPALIPYVAAHVERAYLGVAPAVSVLRSCYGDQTAVVWFCVQLEHINTFAGARDKMPMECQRELARLLITEYGYLKVTEFMLFFHRLKCGRYGCFYGVVDAMFITSALLQFLAERRSELSRYEMRQRERAREEAAREQPACVTYEEYLEWKRNKDGK